MEKTLKEQDAIQVYPVGEVIDISSEVYRLYRFPKGETVLIKQPNTLFIDGNGTHKVTDTKGQTHIVSKGWMHLKFKLEEGSNPELIMEKKNRE